MKSCCAQKRTAKNKKNSSKWWISLSVSNFIILGAILPLLETSPKVFNDNMVWRHCYWMGPPVFHLMSWWDETVGKDTLFFFNFKFRTIHKVSRRPILCQIFHLQSSPRSSPFLSSNLQRETDIYQWPWK